MESPEEMASPKPAILIVTGAYTLPVVWEPFVNSLTEAGFETRCPRLPMNGDSRPPTKTFADDVHTIGSAAQDLKNAGHKIIVLSHSYGGVVATEAITEDLYYRPENPAKGGVAHLLFVAAFTPLKGQSLGTCLQVHEERASIRLAFNEDGQGWIENTYEAFWDDVEPREKGEKLAELVITTNGDNIAAPVTNSPWVGVPMTYVMCQRDKAASPRVQQAMFDAIGETGLARSAKSVSIDAAHSPFVSKPRELLEIVEGIAAELDA